jgi:hypothetical protein
MGLLCAAPACVSLRLRAVMRGKARRVLLSVTGSCCRSWSVLFFRKGTAVRLTWSVHLKSAPRSLPCI